jgi:hypothetical protein
MWGIENIPTAFYNAMKKGYASGNNGVPVPGLANARIIRFQESNLSVIDQWQTGQDGWGFGTISIEAGNRPVWMLQWHGRLDEEVVLFHRHALNVQYQHDNIPTGLPGYFRGCRGPAFFQRGIFTYTNHVDRLSSFSELSGLEHITDNTGYIRGFNEYNARLLMGKS